MSAPATRIRSQTRWLFPAAPAPADVAQLREELHLPEAICRLLASRGFSGIDDAKLYLRPRLQQLSDPTLLFDLDRAVARLVTAVREGETILVHGDYDVDGICSTTLLVRTITALGGNPVPFIPRRIEDGYDLSQAGVEAARAAGATLVVTCDCGTSAHGAIARLQASNIDVKVVAVYIEGLDRANRILRIAERARSRGVRIVFLKAGKSDLGQPGINSREGRGLR